MNETYVYKKRFYDLEKEECWLNEMAEKGLAMKGVSAGFLKDKYCFEQCGERYVYREDYNAEAPVLEEITSPYVMFVKDTYKAEYVCCAMGKVYFRKSAESGDFPLVYTSTESRLAVEKKRLFQYSLLTLVLIFDILMGCCTPLGAVVYLSVRLPYFWLRAIALLIIVACLGYCIKRVYRHSKKITEIKKIAR